MISSQRAAGRELDRGGVDRSAVTTLSGVGSGMSVAIFDAEGGLRRGDRLGGRSGYKRDASSRRVVANREGPVDPSERDSEEVNEEVARRAGAFGVKTVLNAAPARAFETALPELHDILVVNTVKAEMLGSAPVNSRWRMPRRRRSI